MIKCPNAECGYENVDGTQFCEGCGEELPQAGAAAAGAAAAASAPDSSGSATGNMMKCPACDNLNPPENVVCEVCGTELKAGTTSAGDDSATAAPDTAAVQTTPPIPAPTSVPSTDPNTATTSTATAPSAPNPFNSGLDDNSSGAVPSASGTATPPDSALNAALNSDPALTTAPAASAPDLSMPGIGGTADAMTPVVASGPVTSGVTTPDTFAAQTAPVAADSAATGELAPGKVKLVVEQGMTIGKQFMLGDAEILVGREDEDEQIYPDIDLSDQDEGYVHRRHAQLNFANGNLSVMHLGGANKTRLNNKPLPDNEAQPVKIGDKISFGKVVTRVVSV